ncbi:AAA family ATPase [Vibrio scophthalmi]|nr:AAA family ATPase [Vibrio scophthalmi]
MMNVIEQVKAIIERDGLTNAEVSRRSAVSPQILTPLLKGRYTGNTELYVDKLARWLTTYEAGIATRKETCQEPEWVETPTAQALLEMMRLSQGFQAWTMAYEGAGVGKTEAAKRYQKHNSNVWIVTASPNIKSRKAFLAAIAREMGVHTNGMTIDRIDYEIMQRITGSNGLLIVDEAQYTTDDTLNGLRILTENRIGVTLLGNDVVRTRMSASKSRTNMYPVWSRILKSRKIVRSTQKDIQAYLKAWGITDSEVIKWAYKVIPTTTGQLRTLRHLIRLAISIAKDEGSTVNANHMDKAYNFIKEVA